MRSIDAFETASPERPVLWGKPLPGKKWIGRSLVHLILRGVYRRLAVPGCQGRLGHPPKLLCTCKADPDIGHLLPKTRQCALPTVVVGVFAPTGVPVSHPLCTHFLRCDVTTRGEVDGGTAWEGGECANHALRRWRYLFGLRLKISPSRVSSDTARGDSQGDMRWDLASGAAM